MFVNQFLVSRIVYVVIQWAGATAVAAASNKLLVEQMFLGQVVHVVFFLIFQAVYFGKI